MDVKDQDAAPRSRKAEQSEATRAALIAAGRKLFAERGFGAVGTEEIVRAAGVTRGALYHHFRDKKDLFRAVFVAVENELIERIAAEALSQPEPMEQLRRGWTLFLDAALEPEVQRIALIDAPAVLGWQEWREVGRAGIDLVALGLEGAMEAGAIERQPLIPLSHVIVGALDEGALYVAQAPDVERARAEAGLVFERLIDSLQPARR
jgi:AcrR family transcriptional regulator